jgi:O-antigen/teichoic acid export membrane protein
MIPGPIRITGTVTRAIRSVNHAAYAPVLVVAMGLMLLRIVVLARVLEPTQFGEFSTGALVSSTFLMLACLGLHIVQQREMPAQLMLDRRRAAAILTMQCLLAAVVSAIALMAVIIIVGVSVGAVVNTWMVGVLHGIANQYFLIATTESRSRGRPLQYAGENLARAISIFILGIAVATFSGSALITLAAEAALTVAISVMWLKRPLKEALGSVHRAAVLAVRGAHRVRWGSSLRLMALTISSFLLLNMDRWIASSWLTKEAFATYSLSAIVLLIAQAVQSVVSAAVFPATARALATSGAEAAFRISARTSVIGVLVGTVLAIPITLATQEVVGRWMPLYEGATSVIPWLTVAAVFRASEYWTGGLIVLKQERRTLTLNALLAAMGLMSWVVLFPFEGRSDLNLDGLAKFACLLSMANWVVLLITARAAVSTYRREIHGM